MKKSLLFFCSFWLATFMYAQQVTLTGDHLDQFQNNTLDRNFEAYAVFNIDIMPFLSSASTNPGSVDLTVALEGIPALRAHAAGTNLVSDNYFTTTANEKGDVRDEKRPEVYPFSSENIAITVASQFLFGSFKVDGHTYFIEPLWYFDSMQDKNLFVVYDQNDVIEVENITCGALEVAHQKEDLPVSDPANFDKKGQDCYTRTLDLAIASDYSMLQYYGSPGAVFTHNIALMNAVQANFDNDFAQPLVFNIVTQWVSTSIANNPSNSTTHTTFLIQFAAWAEAGGFGFGTSAYDLAHIRTRNLFSAPNGGLYAGAAFLSGLCSADRYAMFSEYTNTLCLLQKTTAHEMGHSFGANHVSSGIMLQGAFCSDEWHPTSIDEVNATLASLSSSCVAASVCPAPFLTQPASMMTLCANVEECYTYNLPCVRYISVSGVSPNLQVTTDGTTICLKALVEGYYTAYIFSVAPVDFCRNILTANQWIINVVPSSSGLCDEFGGDDTDDRVQRYTDDPSIGMRQSSDYITITDVSTNLRQKQIQVCDISGRVLIANSSTDPTIQIPIDQLPAGIFVTQIRVDEKIITHKLIHF